MKVECGHAFRMISVETVGHARAQIVGHIVTAIHVKTVVLVAEWPQIIHSAHVVVVAVRYQKSVDVRRTESKNLRSEIGSAIYKYMLAFGFQQCRASQSFVTRVN